MIRGSEHEIGIIRNKVKLFVGPFSTTNCQTLYLVKQKVENIINSIGTVY